MLRATQRLLGLEDRNILRAATGLGGGIGHEGDTCGALTGGILSLGLYNRDYDFNRLCRDCIEYYQGFGRRFGSTKCRDIIGVRFKEGHDIRRFFLKGTRCLRAVYASIASLFDIIENGDGKLSLRHRYQASPPFGTEEFHCAGMVLSQIESHLGPNVGSILNSTRGFAGGIAFQGDVCGAFMGGVLALGIVYGTEIERTQPARLFKAGFVAMKEGSRVFENEDLHPSFKTSLRVSRLYREFVSRFGSVDCADIIDSAQPEMDFQTVGTDAFHGVDIQRGRHHRSRGLTPRLRKRAISGWKPAKGGWSNNRVLCTEIARTTAELVLELVDDTVT